MDLIQQYLEYTAQTEAPVVFHRWSLLAAAGAALGKRVWLQHGSSRINANLYVMLVGVPGTRKSSTIKIAKNLLQESGYKGIAADKTTKEKFLIDLQERQNPGSTEDDSRGSGSTHKRAEEVRHWLEAAIDDNHDGKARGDGGNLRAACCLIAADEFGDFTSYGNLEFYSTLGVLWDFHGTYNSRVKHGKSVEIWEPCISMLTGNTSTGISLAFPPETLGQGFISRLLFVYSEPTKIKIAFPPPPSAAKTAQIISMLAKLQELEGEVQLTDGAKELITALYESWTDLPDGRFVSYSTRRLTQFFKVATICAACRGELLIDENIVIEANTYLSAIELKMPNALGEFGKSRHSEVAQKIVSFLQHSMRPMKAKQIWKEVHNDLDTFLDLAKVLQNLLEADKIQLVAEQGYLPKHVAVPDSEKARNQYALVDWSLLTQQEREYYGVA